MIVNQQFLDELKIVEALDQEGFEKTLNYSISYIAKSDTTTRLNEILEIDEDDANELLPVFLKLVSFFAKFNAGEREFKAHLEMIQLSLDKKLLFTYKMKESEKHLRKTLGLLERDNELEYANLKWRFDLQVSSRTKESETRPKILLQLDLLNSILFQFKKKFNTNFNIQTQDGKLEGNLLETDYANLKHLYEELNSALKLHNSLAQKKIQKKFI